MPPPMVGLAIANVHCCVGLICMVVASATFVPTTFLGVRQKLLLEFAILGLLAVSAFMSPTTFCDDVSVGVDDNRLAPAVAVAAAGSKTGMPAAGLVAVAAAC